MLALQLNTGSDDLRNKLQKFYKNLQRIQEYEYDRIYMYDLLSVRPECSERLGMLNDSLRQRMFPIL